MGKTKKENEIKKEMPMIYLVDVNPKMTDAWKEYFIGCKNIEIHNCDFISFMNGHLDIDGVVSAANSFGIMDGGLDKIYSDFFGSRLESAVQDRLYEEHFEEQPICSCLVVKIPGMNMKLLHTPSMRTPGVVLDPRIVYQCTRSALVSAVKEHIKKLVMPAFGGLTGGVPQKTIALLQRLAYNDLTRCLSGRRYNTWYNIDIF